MTSNRNVTLPLRFPRIMKALIYGAPIYICLRVKRAYPKFGALLKREPPWDKVARLPMRLLVITIFSITIASLMADTILGSVLLVAYAFG